PRALVQPVAGQVGTPPGGVRAASGGTMGCAAGPYTMLVYTAMWPGLYAAGLSAGLPADLLRVARRGLRDKGRAALGTSAARGHRASVAPLRILAAFPATRWLTIRPRSGSEERGR